MDSHDPSHRRNHTTQSIPLQNMTRPPEGDELANDGATTHRRTISDRGRRLFQTSPSRRQINPHRGTYTPLEDYHHYEPSATLRPVPYEHQSTAEDLSGSSPLLDRGGFQDAINFGPFGNADDDSFPMMTHSALPTRNDRLGNLTGANDSFTSIPSTLR